MKAKSQTARVSKENVVANEKPKIERVYRELELIGNSMHLYLGTGPRAECTYTDSMTCTVDPDPGATETMTCTDMVCSTSEAKFKDKIQAMNIKLVVPETVRFAEEVAVRVRRPTMMR